MQLVESRRFVLPLVRVSTNTKESLTASYQENNQRIIRQKSQTHKTTISKKQIHKTNIY